LREDLYYRLNAFTMSLPPLRERKEEIPILLKHFMSRMSESYARSPLPLSQPLMEACLKHPWPGNLRELNNFIKRYLVLGDEALAASELQPKPDGGAGMHTEAAARTTVATADSSGGGLKSLSRNAKDEAEAEAIARALEETNWNRKQAAALLKISYKALLYKIRQYGIAQSRSTHRLSAGA
jgi:two-component system response regulator AtoC